MNLKLIIVIFGLLYILYDISNTIEGLENGEEEGEDGGEEGGEEGEEEGEEEEDGEDGEEGEDGGEEGEDGTNWTLIIIAVLVVLLIVAGILYLIFGGEKTYADKNPTAYGRYTSRLNARQPNKVDNRYIPPSKQMR